MRVQIKQFVGYIFIRFKPNFDWCFCFCTILYQPKWGLNFVDILDNVLFMCAFGYTHIHPLMHLS